MALQSTKGAFSLLKSVVQQISRFAKPLSITIRSTISEKSLINRCSSCQSFHTTSTRNDLQEFFDNPEIYANSESDSCKVGRPWLRDELRIKSNEDLHKLWYVLLKERNMLMTMEHEYVRHLEPMPSSERFEKVEESMNNILLVVEERNEAAAVLETGKTGKRDPVNVRNVVGLPVQRTPTEHLVPKSMNVKYNLLHRKYEPWMNKYIKIYNEKERNKEQKLKQKVNKLRKEYERKYPDLSKEDLEYGLERYKRSEVYGLFDYEELQKGN